MKYIVEKDNVSTEYEQSKRIDVLKISFPKTCTVTTVYFDKKIREEDVLNDGLWGNYDI